MLRSMTDDAYQTGLPEMTTPTTPGPLTLTKIANNFAMEGNHAYLELEEYVSEDDEARARRHARTGGNTTFKVFKSEDGTLRGSEDGLNIVWRALPPFEKVLDILEMRSNGHHIMKICTQQE